MTATITVVGRGPGGLPPGGAEALVAATLVVGARRHLDAAAPAGVATRELSGDLRPALDAVAAAEGPVAVLASGDPGFFGIVRALAARFGRERLRVLPAVSSVAAAFAAAGLPWDDAVVCSAHGRDPRPAVNACLAHPKVAVLTAPGFGPDALARALVAAGADRRVVVAERLGEPDARVVEVDAAAAAAASFAQPAVAVVLDPTRPLVAPAPATSLPPRAPTRWALDTGEFAHRDGMISKPHIRAAALAALGPGLGDLVWDVGAGSGAVAVECARFGAAVVAVDRDPAATALVAKNAAAHGVAVTVVEGAAPAALSGLADPDAVFVGGGGADLPAILTVVAARARRAVVVCLATFERVAPTLAALTDAGWSTAASMVQAADVVAVPRADGRDAVPRAGGRDAGGAHRLAAHNPVFVVTARR